jgi:hypothetical protein
MVEARSRALWNHTASVLALLANAHRDPKKTRPFTPSDFHPHHRRKPAPAAKVGITALKSVFVDRPQGGQ